MKIINNQNEVVSNDINAFASNLFNQKGLVGVEFCVDKEIESLHFIDSTFFDLLKRGKKLLYVNLDVSEEIFEKRLRSNLNTTSMNSKQLGPGKYILDIKTSGGLFSVYSFCPVSFAYLDEVMLAIKGFGINFDYIIIDKFNQISPPMAILNQKEFVFTSLTEEKIIQESKGFASSFECCIVGLFLFSDRYLFSEGNKPKIKRGPIGKTILVNVSPLFSLFF